MLHTITKILEIWIDINIDINIEISKVDLHTWIFTSRILRVALEVTLLTRIFSYKRLTSCSQKVENLINWEGPNNSAKGGGGGGGGGGEKKKEGGGGVGKFKKKKRGDAY